MKAWADIKYGWIFFWSGFALLAERFWNAFWPALSVVALYIAAACFNVLNFFGPAAHLVLLFLFVAGFSLAVTRLGAMFRFPRRREIRRAIELESALRHRPLETLLDRPVEGTAPASHALWKSYQERVSRLRERLKTYRPKPNAARRDPYALRIGAALLMVLSLAVAQHDAWFRIRQGLYVDVTRWVHVTPAALDAWIVPPDYTHQNPVFLATTQLGAAAVHGPVTVPEGSILKVRIAGFDAPPKVSYGSAAIPPFTEPATHNFTMEMPLAGDGELTIKKGWFRTLGRWQVTVTPDKAPEITLLGTEKAEHAALKIKYKVTDDYGIRKVYGVIAPTEQLRKQVGERTIDFDMPVPDDLKQPEQIHVADLASHPWAGAEVMLTLNAVDAADHLASSEPKKITLPERDFTNPTAKKIIAERKRLIWYDNLITQGLVAKALADIADMPQNYKFDPLVYLGLDMAAKRLSFDGGPEAVDSDIAFLWDLAVRVEDGGLTLAARELSDALQRLSDGLKDKSLTKEQIQALMDDVRQKFREYLKTYMAEMQQMGKQAQLSPEMQEKLMKRFDMDKYMEEMRQLSQGSEREQMQKMAQFLKRNVDNFDAKKRQEDMEKQKKLIDALNQLQKLMEHQQQLLDKTNKMQQQKPQDQQQGKQQDQQQQQDQGQGKQQDQQQQSGGQQGQQSQQQSGQQSGQQGQQSGQSGPQSGQQGEQSGQSGQQSGQSGQQGGQSGQSGQQSQQAGGGNQQGQQSAQGGRDSSFPPQPHAGQGSQQQPDQSGGQQGQQQQQSGGDKGQQQSQAGSQQGQQQQQGGGDKGQQQSQAGSQQGQQQQQGGGDKGQQQSQSGSQQGQQQQQGGGDKGQQQSQSGSQQGQQQQQGGGDKGQQQSQSGQGNGPGEQQQPGQGSEGQQEQQAGGGEGKEQFPDVKTPKEGAAQQNAVRSKLGETLRDVQGLSDIPEFAKADQAMKAAEKSLQEGDARGSAQAQREALNNLQKAVDEILDAMAKQMKPSLGFGPPSEGAGYGDGYDPLGRGMSGDEGNGGGTDAIKIPDEKERRRVQQIIEELRSRSNDYQRSKTERDYIDRLLEQFD